MRVFIFIFRQRLRVWQCVDSEDSEDREDHELNIWCLCSR